jgi:hypothetical protein
MTTDLWYRRHDAVVAASFVSERSIPGRERFPEFDQIGDELIRRNVEFAIFSVEAAYPDHAFQSEGGQANPADAYRSHRQTCRFCELLGSENCSAVLVCTGDLGRSDPVPVRGNDFRQTGDDRLNVSPLGDVIEGVEPVLSTREIFPRHTSNYRPSTLGRPERLPLPLFEPARCRQFYFSQREFRHSGRRVANKANTV